MPLDTVGATRHLSRSDPVMRRIIKVVGPCGLRPGARGDNFTTLLRAIVGQQLSTRAAETIWNRVLALQANGKKVLPEDILSLPDAKLRGAGLSNAKVAYTKDLARKVVGHEISLKRFSHLDDEAIVSLLTSVNGIGRWTVEMFLIFKLGRPDVWPVGDLGIRNAVQRAYGLEPTDHNLQVVAEAWRPWRSVASWYLWRTLAPKNADGAPV